MKKAKGEMKEMLQTTEGGAVTSQGDTPSLERKGQPLVGSVLKSSPKKAACEQVKEGLTLGQCSNQQGPRRPEIHQNS